MVSVDDADSARQETARYSSVMPILDDLLELVGKKATAEEVGGDSNEEIITAVSHSHAHEILAKRRSC